MEADGTEDGLNHSMQRRDHDELVIGLCRTSETRVDIQDCLVKHCLKGEETYSACSAMITHLKLFQGEWKSLNLIAVFAFNY
jgi:hypothetical protein